VQAQSEGAAPDPPKEKPAPAKSRGISKYKKAAEAETISGPQGDPREAETISSRQGHPRRSRDRRSRAEEVETEEAETEEAGPETAFTPRPPAKLERLQKILSRAGIASRRKAEEID